MKGNLHDRVRDHHGGQHGNRHDKHNANAVTESLHLDPRSLGRTK